MEQVDMPLLKIGDESRTGSSPVAPTNPRLIGRLTRSPLICYVGFNMNEIRAKRLEEAKGEAETALGILESELRGAGRDLAADEVHRLTIRVVAIEQAWAAVKLEGGRG